MGGNTFGAPARTYWRRRFLVLAAGLTIVGLAAWGLSSTLAVGSSREAPSLKSASTKSDRSGRSQAKPAPSQSASTPKAHRLGGGRGFNNNVGHLM